MDPDDCLNILEQRPSWTRFTINIAWCYALPGSADILAIGSKLQHGFEDLTKAFPWLAGQVINESRNSADKTTGIFKIVPSVAAPQIIVKDHRESLLVPSMHTLSQAGFASNLLDETILAPRKGFTLSQGESSSVLLIQANIVVGGLILVFSGNHSAMDMPGQAQVIRWFNKACPGEAFTPAELEVGNLQRRDLVPLLDGTYEPGDELLWQTPDPTPPLSTVPKADSTTTQVQPRWATFFFPCVSVASLKATASAACTSPYISTDDALSAFLWQSISRARVHRLGSQSKSTVARAVNVRKFLDIPPSYPGLAQNTLFHTLTLQELCILPLGAVASLLRSTLISTCPSVSFYTRAVATTLSRTPNKGCLRINARLDQSRDITLTSHLTMPAHDLDFALRLGDVQAVRMTRIVEYEGMTVIMPATRDGDVTVSICLRGDDVERLRADEVIGKYAQFSG